MAQNHIIIDVDMQKAANVGLSVDDIASQVAAILHSIDVMGTTQLRCERER